MCIRDSDSVLHPLAEAVVRGDDHVGTLAGRDLGHEVGADFLDGLLDQFDLDAALLLVRLDERLHLDEPVRVYPQGELLVAAGRGAGGYAKPTFWVAPNRFVEMQPLVEAYQEESGVEI